METVDGTRSLFIVLILNLISAGFLYYGGEKVYEQKGLVSLVFVMLISGGLLEGADFIYSLISPSLAFVSFDGRKELVIITVLVAVFTASVGFKLDKYVDGNYDGHPYEQAKWIIWGGVGLMIASSVLVCF